MNPIEDEAPIIPPYLEEDEENTEPTQPPDNNVYFYVMEYFPVQFFDKSLISPE